MSQLTDECIKRFGEHRVSTIFPKKDEEIDLIVLDLELKSPIKVLMTNGLSNYTMPVPEKRMEQSNCELVVCLPSYWEIDNPDERFQWPFLWMHKLANHLIEKQTWYGHGHTFSNGNPPRGLSESMLQNHLMLVDPIALEEQLSPITVKEKTIHFLALVPIFENEFDFKSAKGTFKFLRKYRAKNYDEVLDDFRESCLKSRLKLF
jgi:hypothetical protein